MWGIVIALVSGALMSLQGIFNTEVTKQTSIWVSAGWVQFTALITCILFWFFSIRFVWYIAENDCEFCHSG